MFGKCFWGGLAAIRLATGSLADPSEQIAATVPLAVVSYRQNGKLIALPVRVGGSRALWFVLDSGAPHSVVDAATAARLGLRAVATERGAGVGRGSFSQRRLASLDLRIGPLPLHVPAPLAIDLSHVGVKEPQAGLIGAEVFSRYVVRIDPEKRTVTFLDPQGFLCPRQAAVVPLSAPAGRLYIPMQLTVGKITVVHRMRVDTGSEDAASDNLVRQSPQRRRSLQGVGLGTSFVDYSGVFTALAIASYTIHHVWGASNDHPAVGMEILGRFTTTFDVPHGRLCVVPNGHYRDPVPPPPTQ